MSKVRAVSKLALLTIVLLGACSLADISEHLIPEKVHSETKTFSTEPPIPSITPSVEAPVTQPPDNLLPPRLPCYRPLPFMIPPPPPPPGSGENMAPVTNPLPPVPTCPPEPTPTPLDTKFEIVVVAGSTESGYVDGPGDMARFSEPRGIALDKSGNIYVADSRNQRIRKIEPNGMVSTFAGSGPTEVLSKNINTGNTFEQILIPGYLDGQTNRAKFNYPSGITLDVDENIYIADTHNQMIRKITQDGDVSTLAGSSSARIPTIPGINVMSDLFRPLPSGYQDGLGNVAQFENPGDISFDPINQLFYVVERIHIRKITREGFVTTLKDKNGEIINPAASNSSSSE